MIDSPKGTSRRVLVRQRQARQRRALTLCYARVNDRDVRTCRFPACHTRATDHHHLVYRSHSTALRADPDNVICLCHTHHDWIHALGWVRVTGHAEDVVTWRLTSLGLARGLVLPFADVRPPSAYLSSRRPCPASSAASSLDSPGPDKADPNG